MFGYWVLVGVTLVWTASRAGTVATVLFVLIVLWRFFPDWRLRLTSLLLMALVLARVAATPVDASLLESHTGLLRTNDSRSDYWFRALKDIRRGLPLGYGGGSASTAGGIKVTTLAVLAG